MGAFEGSLGPDSVSQDGPLGPQANYYVSVLSATSLDSIVFIDCGINSPQHTSKIVRDKCVDAFQDP